MEADTADRSSLERGPDDEQQPRLHHISMNCNSSRQGQGQRCDVLRQQQLRHQQLRKSNKPLMERRRRERINNCLDQLKSILMEVSKKESSYYSKLEKADILEMTVKYLKTLKRQHQTASTSSVIDADFDFENSQGDSTVGDDSVSKYVAGFNKCAAEVNSYLASIDSSRYTGSGSSNSNNTECAVSLAVDSNGIIPTTSTNATLSDEVRHCLLQHLADSLTRSTSRQSTNSPDTTTKTTHVEVGRHQVKFGRHERQSLLNDVALPNLMMRPTAPVGVDIQRSSPSSVLFSSPTWVSNNKKLEDCKFIPQHTLPVSPSSVCMRQAEVSASSTGKSLGPLQVLPARLPSGELVFLLAGGGNASVRNSLPGCETKLQCSPNLSERMSTKQEPDATQLMKHASTCDNRDEPKIDNRPMISTSPIACTSTPSTTATPLDFSMRSGSSSHFNDQLSTRPMKQDVDFRTITDLHNSAVSCQKSEVDEKALADLANNNEPSFLSMWRPW